MNSTRKSCVRATSIDAVDACVPHSMNGGCRSAEIICPEKMTQIYNDVFRMMGRCHDCTHSIHEELQPVLSNILMPWNRYFSRCWRKYSKKCRSTPYCSQSPNYNFCQLEDVQLFHVCKKVQVDEIRVCLLYSWMNWRHPSSTEKKLYKNRTCWFMQKLLNPCKTKMFGMMDDHLELAHLRTSRPDCIWSSITTEL